MGKYKVIGKIKTGFAVVDRDGAAEYDLIESREEANTIRNILNDGIGPEWDAVSAEIERRGKASA